MRAVVTALFLLLSLGGSVPALAQTSVFLDSLTSPELQAAVAAGTTTVIVPIGGTEQNGTHMALGKHNARVKFLSARIARELGNTLVAPVVAYVPEGAIDPPTQHMRFPGTISVSEDAFEKLLESAARSLRRHGFKDVVFLGDHGGYQRNIRHVAERLNREWSKSPARAHEIPEYYAAVEKEYPALLEQRGHTLSEIGTHAGLADTSLTLALVPGMVRTERMKDEAGLKGGVNGDPSRSTAELGRAGADLIASRTVEAIRKAIKR